MSTQIQMPVLHVRICAENRQAGVLLTVGSIICYGGRALSFSCVVDEWQQTSEV